jgi:hypothetical protein
VSDVGESGRYRESSDMTNEPGKRAARCVTTIMALLLAGCGAWERASVTVTYGIGTQSDERYVANIGRKSVKNAFKSFAEQNGFKCRPDFKHPDEMTCRGPKDLYNACSRSAPIRVAVS